MTKPDVRKRRGRGTSALSLSLTAGHDVRVGSERDRCDTTDGTRRRRAGGRVGDVRPKCPGNGRSAAVGFERNTIWVTATDGLGRARTAANGGGTTAVICAVTSDVRCNHPLAALETAQGRTARARALL